VADYSGKAPRFGLAERRYVLESLRWVEEVIEVEGPSAVLPGSALAACRAAGGGPVWVSRGPGRSGGSAGGAEGPGEWSSPAREAWCAANGVAHRVVWEAELAGFPEAGPCPPAPGGGTSGGPDRVVVTGCFDWLHSGHLRFFEEASAFGELTVVVGSDANLRLLKGEGHPLFPQAERRYVVSCVRAVARCLVATGSGWLDAEPEIGAIGATRYLVNEDGDRPEKREYCRRAGIEYIVLRREPREGLPRRASSDLRGF